MVTELSQRIWAPLTLELVKTRSSPMCLELKENFIILQETMQLQMMLI